MQRTISKSTCNVESIIEALVKSLESLLKRPILDQTGLSNRYDWVLQWETKNSDPSGTAALQGALREQLGLGLDIAERKVDVIVVDKTN